MKSFISRYQILTPFGLGVDTNLKAILDDRCAIKAVPPKLNAGQDFPVPYYGAIEFESLGYDPKNDISKYHFVARKLIESLGDSLVNQKLDAVVILSRHLSSGEPIEKKKPPVHFLNPDFFIANYIRKYLHEVCNLAIDPRSFFEINNTCTTGTSLLTIADQGINYSGWKKVLLIGIDLADPFNLASLFNLGALSGSAASPEKSSRPFDKARNGFVKTDGGAIAIVEAIDSQSLKNSDFALGILGSSQTSDAYRITDGRQDGELARLAMEQAVARSGIKIEDFSFIKTHGTGTLLNDESEAQALLKLIKDPSHGPWITSLKGHLGHTNDVSGLLETVLAGFALKKKIILPTKNLDDPQFDLKFVKSPINVESGRYFLSNNFGFGGYNASIVMDAGL